MSDPRFAPTVPTYVAIRYALGEVVTRDWQTTGKITERVARLVPGAGRDQVLRQLKRGTNLYEKRLGSYFTVASGGEYAWRKLR